MADRTDVDSTPVVIGSRTSAATGADRTVVLVRYRSGVVGETRRTMHVVQLPPHCP